MTLHSFRNMQFSVLLIIILSISYCGSTPERNTAAGNAGNDKALSAPGGAVSGAISFREGPLAGRVYSINRNSSEIVVQSDRAIGNIPMGSRLYTRIDGKAAVMRATFPMQTVVKCRLEGRHLKYLASVRKGMPVYKYYAGVENSPKSIIPRDGLVAEYLFNGGAHDSSGNGLQGEGHDVTLTHDRFGRNGSAYHFNGKTSYIEIEESDKLNIRNSITMSAWFKPESFGDWRGIVVKSSSSTRFYGYALRLPAKAVCCSLRLSDSDNSEYYYPMPNIENKWYHAVGVYNKNIGKVYLYVDGRLVLEKAASGEITNSFFGSYPLLIGRDSCTVGSRYFHGSIDDVRVYNRSLSGDEVRTLYNEAGLTK